MGLLFLSHRFFAREFFYEAAVSVKFFKGPKKKITQRHKIITSDVSCIKASLENREAKAKKDRRIRGDGSLVVA
jgi:hypothetical protein